MASIRDVAKLAGVSITTVSRVINKRGRTSKETEEKVWWAVEALQYQPNLLARGLRSQKTKLLGLLVPDIDSPFFARLAKYVEEAAYRKGYNLILCNVGEDPKKEKHYLGVLIQRQVEGIIFPRVSDESLFARTPRLSKIPYVVLDRTLEREEAPYRSTFVIVTHDIAILASVADLIAVMYAGKIVETGKIRDIIRNPLHPYTHYLIKSLPRVGDRSLRVSIPGSPPSLSNPPVGCRFHPRCPYFIPGKCDRSIPEMVDVGQDHKVSCFLFSEKEIC